MIFFFFLYTYFENARKAAEDIPDILCGTKKF